MFPCSVFVLPIFEVERDQEAPRNKTELVALFREGLAVWFHYVICPTCHTIPAARRWINDDNEEMRIIATVKRQNRFDHWEPLYIGTNDEPFHDERLSWEGKSDKMTQAFVMCLLDYNFHVLSNAFLVHKPGIKSVKEAERFELEQASSELIRKTILPEIEAFYGKRRGCKI